MCCRLHEHLRTATIFTWIFISVSSILIHVTHLLCIPESQVHTAHSVSGLLLKAPTLPYLNKSEKTNTLGLLARSPMSCLNFFFTSYCVVFNCKVFGVFFVRQSLKFLSRQGRSWPLAIFRRVLVLIPACLGEFCFGFGSISQGKNVF